MIRILAIGLGLAILGLNLIMIWATLMVTTASAEQIEKKQITKGIVVALLGFLVFTLGWCRLGVVPAEGSVILMAGSQMSLLGLAWIVSAIARGNERYVRYIRKGAWIVAKIGVALILAYGIVVYVIN